MNQDISPTNTSLQWQKAASAEEVGRIVDAIIAKYRNNSKALIQLAVENVVILTGAEVRVKQVAAKGLMARAVRAVCGKNRKLRQMIASDLVCAQYAAAHMLQKIMEQNMLNLKLTTAISKRLKDTTAQIEGDFHFLESRVAKLEKLVALISGNSHQYSSLAGVGEQMQKE